MQAMVEFLGGGTAAAAVLVAGLLGGAVAIVRLALRDMYASSVWRLHRHWDE
jgi:hypothetical protein